MIYKGFKMKLYDGMAEEYEKRHNELWPEILFSSTRRQWFFTGI